MAKSVTKAVLPVAGLGTRFLPATKVMAKEMLPVVDKPLIQYAVEEAMEAGVTDIILVAATVDSILARHFETAPELEAALEKAGKQDALAAIRDGIPKPNSVSIAVQDKPLGLGHAVWCARDAVGDEPFAVLLPDDLMQASPGCLSQMMKAYGKTGGNIAAVEDVPRERTARYGILDVADDDGRIVRARTLVEKPKPEDAPSTLAIIGRYILQPEIFAFLEDGKTGAGGEIQLTDAMVAAIDRVPFHGVRIDGRRFDCGSKLGFVEANAAFALARDDLGDVAGTLKAIIE